MIETVQFATGRTLNGLTCVVDLPAPATEGNLLLAIQSNNRATGNAAAPAGFVEMLRAAGASAANLLLSSKISTGGESSFTGSATIGNSRILTTVIELSGVDYSEYPREINTSTVAAANAYTTPVDDGGDYYLACFSSGTGIANPALFTEWTNGFETIFNASVQVNSNNIAQAVGQKSSTASESSTTTWSGAAVTGVGALIRLKPAAGAVAAVMPWRGQYSTEVPWLGNGVIPYRGI